MTSTIALSLLLIATVSSATEPGDDDHPLFPLDHGIIKPEEQAKHDMEKYDHDKDGKVSLEEMMAEMRQMYYKNKSTKKVDKEVKADATEYLTEIDANKDGALELEEFLKYHEEEMKDPDNVKNPHPDQDPLHDY